MISIVYGRIGNFFLVVYGLQFLHKSSVKYLNGKLSNFKKWSFNY